MVKFNSGARFNSGSKYNSSEKAIDKDSIIKKVHSVVSDELRDVPFDEGLPRLREILWDIADEIGVEGADVLGIYMDWASKQK